MLIIILKAPLRYNKVIKAYYNHVRFKPCLFHYSFDFQRRLVYKILLKTSNYLLRKHKLIFTIYSWLISIMKTLIILVFAFYITTICPYERWRITVTENLKRVVLNNFEVR